MRYKDLHPNVRSTLERGRANRAARGNAVAPSRTADCIHLQEALQPRGKRENRHGHPSGCRGCWLMGCEKHTLCTIREESPDPRIRSCQKCADYKSEEEEDPSFSIHKLIIHFDESNLFPDTRGKRFNASLMKWKNGYALAYRDGWRGSNIWVAVLDESLRPISTTRLRIHHRDANYGREDPRLFLFQGRPHVAFVGVVGGIQVRHTNVLYARLRDDFSVEQVFSPRYEKRNLWEKNWSFFEYEGELFAVYSTSPHRILRIRGEAAELAYESDFPLPWKIGTEIRGGTSPIRIDDEYWHFFHSRVVRGGLRVYCMGLLCFEARPPFRIVKIVPEPIYWSDPATKPADQYASVVFPCGAVWDGECFLVSSGIHDRWTEIHEFNKRELESRMVRITMN